MHFLPVDRGTLSDAVTIAEVTKETLSEFTDYAHDMIAVRASDPRYTVLHTDKLYLNDLRLYLFRGARIYVLLEHAIPQAMHVLYFAKTPGRVSSYVNSYLVWALPTSRSGQGIYPLWWWTLEEGVRRGCTRFCALVDSWDGAAWHMAMHHTVWGVSPHGDLILDVPLTDVGRVAGVPPRVRTQYGVTQRISPSKLTEALLSPTGKFRATPEQLARVLKLYRVTV